MLPPLPHSVHLEVKPYNCNSCSQCFTTSRNRKRHIDIVHLKVTPHKCTDCEMAFYEKTDLKNHIDIKHLRLKPFRKFTCTESGKLFFQNANFAFLLIFALYLIMLFR